MKLSLGPTVPLKLAQGVCCGCNGRSGVRVREGRQTVLQPATDIIPERFEDEEDIRYLYRKRRVSSLPITGMQRREVRDRFKESEPE